MVVRVAVAVGFVAVPLWLLFELSFRFGDSLGRLWRMVKLVEFGWSIFITFDGRWQLS